MAICGSSTNQGTVSLHSKQYGDGGMWYSDTEHVPTYSVSVLCPKKITEITMRLSELSGTYKLYF
jgi:hypothetical protein